MMEFLQNLVDGSNFPLLTAFLLGLMTAISPCPLATNITATAYLSKDIGDKRRVMFNGVFYTLGRMFTYTVLGLIFYFLPFPSPVSPNIYRFLLSGSSLSISIAL